MTNPAPDSHSEGSGGQNAGDEKTPGDGSDEESSDRDDGIVWKANRLICSQIDWTVLQHRAFAVMAAQISPEDERFAPQRFDVKRLTPNLASLGGDDEEQRRTIREELLSQAVHVRSCNGEGHREYQGYNCFSTCQYDPASEVVEAKFNDGMAPFLLRPDRPFTAYRLEEFMQLGSPETMRIYELIKMAEGEGELVLSIERLRGLIGREENGESFSTLNRRVLRPAQAEIEKRCDTYFTYAVEQDGPRPVRVQLTVRRREASGRPSSPRQSASEESSAEETSP